MKTTAEFTTTLINSDKIEAGAVLVSSWGWEQTNIDFYQVTQVTAAGNATLVKLKTISRPTGSMTTEVLPLPEIDTTFKPIRRKVKAYGQGYVNIETYSSAQPWDGKPARASHYA